MSPGRRDELMNKAKAVKNFAKVTKTL